MGYMESSLTNGWGGYATPQQASANKIDHIADKMAFAIDMANTQLLAIEGIENEIRNLVSSDIPPRKDQLMSLSTRLNTYQMQLRDSLTKIKQMTKEIDITTDSIQTSATW